MHVETETDVWNLNFNLFISTKFLRAGSTYCPNYYILRLLISPKFTPLSFGHHLKERWLPTDNVHNKCITVSWIVCRNLMHQSFFAKRVMDVSWKQYYRESVPLWVTHRVKPYFFPLLMQCLHMCLTYIYSSHTATLFLIRHIAIIVW